MRTTTTIETGAKDQAAEMAAAGFPVRVEHGGEVRWGTDETCWKLADELVAKHGAGVPKMTRHAAKDAPAAEALTEPKPPLAKAAPKANSDIGTLVVDEEARARIEAQHEALRKGGVAVDAGEQFFATGTRMADVGYATQEERAREHAKKLPVLEAAGALAKVVEAERRRDVVVAAEKLAASVHVNGKVTVLDGFALSDQAIKGMMSRVESPSTRYLLGIRERSAEVLRAARREERKLTDEERARLGEDRRRFAEVLAHELRRAGSVELKLRCREGRGDVYAAVSPGYAPADAPETIAQIAEHLPAGAKGSWAYDPTTTAWELRAEVWTPTPVAEQAVGEPFEGYASFQSRDNGTSRLRGGGGVFLLRCLNASTYSAKGSEFARMHRANVLSDFEQVVSAAVGSIDACCAAWGVAREQGVALPLGDDGGPIPLEVAIPGFWRWLLSDRRSELAAVLPGRTEQHVAKLTELYDEQRRDRERVVRADFCQAWTRYAQDQPSDVRREAEVAAGAFLVDRRRVGCDLRD